MLRFASNLSFALFSAALAAQEPAAKPERQLKFESGKVTIGRNIATIDLPETYRYLQAADARYVVEKQWGNPPDPSVLGMVVDSEDFGWGIIVSYEESGHVKDDDAADMNYDDLLKEMQDDAKSANAERRKAGYPAVELLGWAEPPHYDAKEKKIYWAKKLDFEGSKDVTLNYDVRVLGADGVLVMSAVAAVADLGEVAKAAKAVLARTELAPGKRYADYDPKLHKVAAYGIGGLIAGKVLAKAGLLKVLLKPLLVVGALLIGVVARAFGKKKQEPAADAR